MCWSREMFSLSKQQCISALIFFFAMWPDCVTTPQCFPVWMQWWPMLGLVGLFCILTNAEQRFLARALCICTPTAQPHSNEQRTRPEGNEYTTKPTVYSRGQSQDTTNYSVILKLRGIDSIGDVLKFCHWAWSLLYAHFRVCFDESAT